MCLIVVVASIVAASSLVLVHLPLFGMTTVAHSKSIAVSAPLICAGAAVLVGQSSVDVPFDRGEHSTNVKSQIEIDIGCGNL